MEELDGPGTVSGVPHLPDGFADTFTSVRVRAGTVNLHAVVGGDGPPLLLIPGWPQTWYAWRLVMPGLARDFRVVAVDLRGVGRSDKPVGGYDTGTLAADLAALMPALGHERYAVAGHDIGMWVAYALASDHPDAVVRLAVAEAMLPGLSATPPLLMPGPLTERVFHFAFNRLAGLNEALVRGREDVYFGHQFASKAAVPLSEHAIAVYVDALRAGDDALRASFDFYRALDETMAQNERRGRRKLVIPVLAVGGRQSAGGAIAELMRTTATEVAEAVLDDCGHYPAEEAPEALLAVLRQFLAPLTMGATSSTAAIG